MDDVDFAGWELPPLEDDPDAVPPPPSESWGGVSIGSELVGLRRRGSVNPESQSRSADRGNAIHLSLMVC